MRFDGTGNASKWMKQAHLAKSLLGLDDLSTVMPMFLDGDAFDVYDQLTDEDKKDAGKIEKALITAFGADRFTAYDELRTRVCSGGETVDVFLADLRRLAKLTGLVPTGNDDALLKLSFVMGLPKRVSAQIRATPKIDSMTLGEVLTVARALMTNAEQLRSEVGAVAMPGRTQGRNGSIDEREKDGRLRCFGCGGPHMRKFCKTNPVACFKCGEIGHIARRCKNVEASENDTGALRAPAAAPGH